MAEYSRLAKGSFTAASGQTSAVIPLPFLPDYVEVWNLTNIGNAGSTGNITRAWWDNNIPPFTPSGKSASQTMCEVYQSNTSVIFDTIYTNGVTAGTAPANGISSFSGGIALQYGPSITVSSFTNANPAVFTTSTNHGYAVGTTVILEGLGLSAPTKNTQLLNGVPFTISAVTSNTFTVKWDTSNVGQYPTSTGVVKQVLYPFLYAPQVNVVTALTLSTTTQVTTAMYHNFTLGQQVAFRIPQVFGTTQLNSLPNVLIPGQPIYGYVTSIVDNWTFVVAINSTGYTAFTVAATISAAQFPGIDLPQVVPVGDVNTGGESILLASLPYQPPLFPTFSNRVSTINGPAIRGAFVNNTQQGFVIGAGTPQQQAGTGTIVTSGSIILWHAYQHDYANP